MHADRLKKYRDAMESFGVEKIEAVRASAEALPFRTKVFDPVLSLMFLSILANRGRLLQKSTELLKRRCNHNIIAVRKFVSKTV